MINKLIQPKGELTTRLHELQVEVTQLRPMESRGTLTSHTTRGVIREVNVAEETIQQSNDSIPRWG